MARSSVLDPEENIRRLRDIHEELRSKISTLEAENKRLRGRVSSGSPRTQAAKLKQAAAASYEEGFVDGTDTIEEHYRPLVTFVERQFRRDCADVVPSPRCGKCLPCQLHRVLSSLERR